MVVLKGEMIRLSGGFGWLVFKKWVSCLFDFIVVRC